MGLYAVKPWFVGRLKPIEDGLVRKRVSPDALTYAAFAVSLTTGAAIAAGSILNTALLWLLVPPLCLARLALNALDGSIARRTSSSRPFGKVLNEVIDRCSDAAMLGSFAFVAPPALAAWAVAAAFGTSLTGILTESLTGGRASGGPMGKADRVAVVAIASAVAAGLGSESPFAIALVVVIAGCLLTSSARVVGLRRELSDVVR
jgi:CDP-diacylglycerol---glycerol-3-phosphate 3-phosphatidyltransferase